MFSRRSPDDIKSPDADRDIFNEKPSKEDIISATEGQGQLLYIWRMDLYVEMGVRITTLFDKDVVFSN